MRSEKRGGTSVGVEEEGVEEEAASSMLVQVRMYTSDGSSTPPNLLRLIMKNVRTLRARCRRYGFLGLKKSLDVLHGSPSEKKKKKKMKTTSALGRTTVGRFRSSLNCIEGYFASCFLSAEPQLVRAGLTFIVKEQKAFAENILPKYFRE